VADEPGDFDSPEDAALAGWPPAARPRVVSVTVRGDRAEVEIDMMPSYQYWVYCIRRNGRWREVVSGNGPNYSWDDPSSSGNSWFRCRAKRQKVPLGASSSTNMRVMIVFCANLARWRRDRLAG
jgi:hypothetical protein